MKPPRISVIVPTHNRPQLLAEALASLASQTFTDWEAIVVDDASMPPVSHETCDPRIRVVRVDPGRGGAAAKNRGIAEACGDFIAYLDDDDLYAPTYLESALNVFDHDPAADIVYMGVAWFGKNGEWGQDNYNRAMDRFLAVAGGIRKGDLSLFGTPPFLQALVNSVPMAFQRPVVRRSALNRIGGYRDNCLLWDCDWAIRAALETRAALIHTGLYLQRAAGQGYSSNLNREVEQLHSAIDIMQTLWNESRAGSHSEYVHLFRSATAGRWFNLAWHYYLNGEIKDALLPLWRSARIQPGLAHLKLLANLAVPRKQVTKCS
jgi:glycosyltransferase involved in cell wall biosynthesis